MKRTLKGVPALIVVSFLSLSGCASLTPSPAQTPEKKAEVVQSAADAAKAPSYVDPATGMEFVLVKGGCYQMGDTFGGGEKDETPVHQVCVADFYLGKYEVTQSQWEKVMGANPSSNKECGAQCPVDSVNWNAVQDYAKRLSGKSGVEYRLPTEAEWEYAARSGGKNEKWSGVSEIGSVKDFAWYGENSDSTLHPVGLKKPNGLGLYDMSGNAREWCLDWYSETYYADSPKDNPAGPATGQKRVVRSGTFGRDAAEARTAKRAADDPTVDDGEYSFRLLLPAK